MTGGDDFEGFLADLTAEAGIPTLDAGEAAAVLDLTRVVAHQVERRLAPLTAYALGLALDPSLPPAARAQQARDLTETVRRLAAAQPGEVPGGAGP